MVGPRPGKPGIDEGDEAWIAGTNYHLKLTRQATMPRVEEKKGRVTRTFRCKGYFAGKGARGADTLETPLSAVDATSLFRNDFYFGKPRKKQKQLFLRHLQHAGEGEVGPGEEGRREGHGRLVAATRSARFNGRDTRRHWLSASPPWGTLSHPHSLSALVV